MRDASETSLREQPGLKRVANLQALPELFNCHIFRSEGKILNVLPQSPSVCFPWVYFELLTIQVIFWNLVEQSALYEMMPYIKEHSLLGRVK